MRRPEPVEPPDLQVMNCAFVNIRVLSEMLRRAPAVERAEDLPADQGPLLPETHIAALIDEVPAQLLAGRLLVSFQDPLFLQIPLRTMGIKMAEYFRGLEKFTKFEKQ